jgi:hypothetical protein
LGAEKIISNSLVAWGRETVKTAEHVAVRAYNRREKREMEYSVEISEPDETAEGIHAS